MRGQPSALCWIWSRSIDWGAAPSAEPDRVVVLERLERFSRLLDRLGSDAD